MGDLRRIDGPKPASVTPSENDTVRRMSALHGIGLLMDDVKADSDADRLALLADRLGDIAAAYRFGYKDITHEYQRLAAAAARFVEDDLRRAAR
jgi:hypothetical protein